MNEQQYRLLNVGEVIPECAEWWDSDLKKWGRTYRDSTHVDTSPVYRVPIEPDGWVKCSDRMPTEADAATDDGFLTWQFKDGKTACYPWDTAWGHEATHWCPAPKPPEPEPDAFEVFWQRHLTELGFTPFDAAKKSARAAYELGKKEGAE